MCMSFFYEFLTATDIVVSCRNRADQVQVSGDRCQKLPVAVSGVGLAFCYGLLCIERCIAVDLWSRRFVHNMIDMGKMPEL